MSVSPYKMTISLSVLKHLGINLYSNVPAVLSELVANAWDADAQEVSIKITDDKKVIAIHDTGCGMTLDELNDKFLNVGFQKRQPGVAALTGLGRHVMGRKGIGKLSAFSVAGEVEVHSVKNGQKNGFIMRLKDIEKLFGIPGKEPAAAPTSVNEEAAKSQMQEYRPMPVDSDRITITSGTQIIMRELDTKITRMTEKAVRTRLARRFTVINSITTDPKDRFDVNINAVSITAQDRDLYNNLEMIWCIGEESKQYHEKAKSAVHKAVIDEKFRIDGTTYQVTGWLGTVKEQKDIDEDSNVIILYAHGKLVQEDLLKDLKEAGIYATYLMGEIQADVLDADTLEDIVTSDRQRLKEEDFRFVALKEYLQKYVLKKIQNEWTKIRNQVGTDEALKNELVKEWFDTLSSQQQKYAKGLFGKINTFKIKDDEAKRELYRSAVIGFQTLAARENLGMLDKVETLANFEVISEIFQSTDEIEMVHYHKIIKTRLDIINQFEKLFPTEREKVIQRFLAEHLWLVNPAWERATTGSTEVERSLTTIFKTKIEGDAGLRNVGRVDIYYNDDNGEHVIIELKKYDVRVDYTDLLKQIGKYRSALHTILAEKFPGRADQPIKLICLLGSAPQGDTQDKIRQHLNTSSATFYTYDELLKNAKDSYAGYLQKQRGLSKLVELVERLESDSFKFEKINSIETPTSTM